MINRVYKGIAHTTGARNYVEKGTEVAPIKYGTFHYAAYAGNASAFGKGGAFSSFIEFEYYISGGVTLSKGDLLLYAQEWDTDTSFVPIEPTREQGINVFYVSEIKERRETIYVLAYDCVESLLNVDFSEVLKANEGNFPMTVAELYGLVVTQTNVFPPWFSVALTPQGRDHYWKQATVNYFYSPGITARDILNWISEMIGSSVVELYDGDDLPGAGSINRTETKTFSDAENEYWLSADSYIVCPGEASNPGAFKRLVTADGDYITTADGEYLAVVGVPDAISVWYKENGLEAFNTFPTYDGVEIISTNGTVLGKYYTSTPASRVLQIRNNLIAENINTFSNIYNAGSDTGVAGTYNDLAEDILARANTIAGMTSATIHLFPFRCPFSIGSRMYCVDKSGNQFVVPIMSIDLTDAEVVIGSVRPGDSIENEPINTNDSNDFGLQELWSKINDLELQLKRVTGTTNANGNIFTTIGNDYVAVSAFRTLANSICTPFFRTADSTWGIHVANYDGSVVANTSVVVWIAYLKKKIAAIVPN